MKNVIYFQIILAAFTACKLNSGNETVSEVKETTIVQPVSKVDSIKPQQIQEVENQPKTKDELWNEYWTKFTTAIKQKDKETMLELALKSNEVSLNGYSFDDGGGGGTAVDFVNNDFWSDWLSIANNKKIKITTEKNRTIVENYIIFEFIKGRWVWIGVMGD